MSSQSNWNNPDMYYQQPQSNSAGTYGAQSYGQTVGYAANGQYAATPGYIYQPLPPTNTLAIIALCASIAGVVSTIFLGGIAGIIMGHIARRQIRERGERGDGLAVGALWVGYIGAGLMVLIWLFIIFVYFGMFALLFAVGASAS